MTPATPSTRGISAAFFDLDGTLIRGDSQTAEALHLLGQGPWHPLYLLRLAVSGFANVLPLSIHLKNRLYLKTCTGRSRQFLWDQARILFAQTLENRLIPRSLDLMEAHRQRGDLIVLVSATTHHLILPFVEKLVPHFYFCTHLAYGGDGRCKGRAVNTICAAEEKVGAIRKLARDQSIDLAASHAYSDHPSDLPLLEAVGRPSVINPTPELARIARRRGWPCHNG